MVKLVRRGALAVSAISLLALSCQALLGIDDPDLQVAQADGGGGEDASIDSGRPSCGLQPPPPSGNGSGTGQALIFALRKVLLGSTRDNAGFDLDRACTCSSSDRDEAAKASCLGSGDSGAPSCDFDSGVDNSLLVLSSRFGDESVKKFSAGIEKEYDCGRQTLILILQDYNGEANDDDVKLFATTSFGIRTQDDGGSDCAPTFRARWDGTDLWSVGDDAVSATGTPQRPSFRGYVTGNHLVVDGRTQDRAGPPAAPIPLVGFGSPPMTMAHPLLTATLTPADGGISLTDGILAGRSELQAALRSLGSAPTDNDQVGCQMGAWPFIRDALCQAADMMADPTRDFAGAQCDALSLVAAFEAAPAKIRTEPADAAPPAPAGVCEAGDLVCP